MSNSGSVIRSDSRTAPAVSVRLKLLYLQQEHVIMFLSDSRYMKKLLRDFFTFSALEKKGLALLIVLLLMITGLNYFLAHHTPEIPARDIALLEKELRSFEQQLTRNNDDTIRKTDWPAAMFERPAEEFLFDPNTATASELIRLGMSSRLTRTLLSYRKHGGRFYRKEDLKKIYGLEPQLYARLASLVRIDAPLPPTAIRSASVMITVNVNAGDSADFEKLSGIGPVLARRIVRYRSLLGGFYTTTQIKEVYGISDSLFSALVPRLTTDTSLIVKINVNTATEKELARHPYIGKYTAGGILRYRNRVKTIKSLDELTTHGILTRENQEKLKKYLSI
jgi:competence protein ComEA